MSTITVGVDLSTTKGNRGVVTIDWSTQPVTVTAHRDKRDLDSIVELAELGTTAIDAPFGWPAPFVEFVQDPTGFHEQMIDSEYENYSRDLRLRTTDRWVKEKYPDLNPLSVSMDKLGATAVVCGALRERIRKSGCQQDIIEAYPKATAHVLGLDGSWESIAAFLEVDAKSASPNEHEADAFLAAITARCKDVAGSSEEAPNAPRAEGSIVLPRAGVTLARLVS
jgi:predicted nuclease with RNAse H fold